MQRQLQIQYQGQVAESSNETPVVQLGPLDSSVQFTLPPDHVDTSAYQGNGAAPPSLAPVVSFSPNLSQPFSEDSSLAQNQYTTQQNHDSFDVSFSQGGPGDVPHAVVHDQQNAVSNHHNTHLHGEDAIETEQAYAARLLESVGDWIQDFDFLERNGIFDSDFFVLEIARLKIKYAFDNERFEL
jgi:hypothetical protein